MMSKRPTAPSAAVAVSHFAKFAMIATAAWAGAITDIAYAGPTGSQVVQGNVTFENHGNRTIIRASDGSIINHLNFNIGPNEIVRFIQPNEFARVLNRVTGADPSMIQGTLRANGQVYIVNPAGVYFHNGAVVNVAGLHAAAGSLSNVRFSSGIDKFHNLSGEVVNEGLIKGNTINLIGQSVANHGTIKAPEGVVVMAAGNEVFLREQNGKITVKVDGVNLSNQTLPHGGTTTPDINANAGVENTGTITARRGAVTLGAGDMYALAIRNSGQITANKGEVTLAAADGLVHNTQTGVIGADAVTGKAGSVVVQGPSVMNEGTISADSEQGRAGYVEVTSQNHTYLTEGSVISAAGGDGNAKGGEVLVHSYDGITVMSTGATVDVSGGEAGGDGGFAEVSGKLLTFNGFADLDAKDGHNKGTLLLDPYHIIINADGGFDVSSGTVNFDDPDTFTNIYISAAALQALAGAIQLQATGDIAVFHPIAFVNGNDLTLEAYRDIFIFAPITGAGNLVLTANYNNNGVGNIYIEALLNINGNSTMSGVETFLQGESIISGGRQDYLGRVNLCLDTTLTASSVKFHDMLNALLSGQQGLTVNIVADSDGGEPEGELVFDGTVGIIHMLKNLHVNGNTEINGGAVFTRNFQRYMGDTALGADAALMSFNNGEVRFGGALDGKHNLFVATGGLTRFDGPTGMNAKLESVITDGPGQTRLGGDMKAGIIALGDDVQIANDITLTGSDLVDFAKTVEGNNFDLIVKSPLTYFHGDATGFDLLQTDANGTTYFGGSGFDDGAPPVMISGNVLSILDEAIVVSDVHFYGKDLVHFGQTLNGAFNVAATSDRQVHFGGDVGDSTPLASLLAAAGHPSINDQNFILIDGTLMRVDGDIVFNPQGRNNPAQVATIAARNQGGVLIHSLNGSILMAQNEKLTSLGDLTMMAENGIIAVGDLNSVGDMNVISPEIYLILRKPGSILNPAGGFDPDTGLDIVAGGSIDFSSKPIVLGDGAAPIFAIGEGKSATNLDEFEVRTFTGLTKSQYKRGDTVLDLTPPNQNFLDLIDQARGPNRINDRVILDPLAIVPMGDLAINSRDLSGDELRGATTGRYLPLDTFNKPPSGNPSDYTVAINRLRRDAIVGSLNEYSVVFFKEEVDEETGEVTKANRTQEVRAALGKAWKSYLDREDAGGNLDPAGFHTFLQNDPEQNEALAYFNGLKTLVTGLKISGMTSIELRNSLNHVLPEVQPEGMTQQEFETSLGVETMG